MIKLLTLILISLFSQNSTSNDQIIGKWSSCYTNHPKIDFEHRIEFKKNSEATDFLLIDEKNTKYPCLGNISLGITRKWAFSVNKNYITSKLLKTGIMAYEDYVAKLFSEYSICGLKSWKKDHPIECKSQLPFGIEKNGEILESTWKLIDKETLELIDHEGFSVIYKKDHE